jgi:predicted alpha/beta-hydrolase family hydrolase
VTEQPASIAVGDKTRVSGLLVAPPKPVACYVLAHGAGAGMAHPIMATVARGLAERGVGTLRYQFPYMEQRGKRPDPPPVAQATVRAACAEAGRLLPGVPLFAGGKSFGGRMTSQAQAAKTLEGIRGLLFLGFPLHPPKKPSANRAEHLARVQIPMLFLQGTRDELADLSLLKPVVEGLGPRATLHVLEHADHSFHVLVRSGRKDTEVMTELLDTAANWIKSLLR